MKNPFIAKKYKDMTDIELETSIKTANTFINLDLFCAGISLVLFFLTGPILNRIDLAALVLASIVLILLNLVVNIPYGQKFEQRIREIMKK